MSLVGPTPGADSSWSSATGPSTASGSSVKPGLTGPMQVYGRGELTFEERLAVELDYVENLSIGRDLRILARHPAERDSRHRGVLSTARRQQERHGDDDRSHSHPAAGGRSARLARPGRRSPTR